MTFSPSDETVDFMISIYQEGIYEAAESVFLFLEPAVNETAVETAGTAEVLIMDNDSEYKQDLNIRV